ncbi:unnamed protein product [Symbiodinium sp. KB8]|nr:unnamed protein product [Symbiodinium sp. KB8]
MTVSLYRHCLQVSGASPASSKKKKKRLQKSEETEQVCPASSKKKTPQKSEETEQVSGPASNKKKKKRQKSEETETGPASFAVAADRAGGGHHASSIDDSQVFYARGDALVKDVEKESGPLHTEILKAVITGDIVQRTLRKNIRENCDDDNADGDKEEDSKKPRAKSKAKAKAKAATKSKAKAKSKPQPKIERSHEDVMSDAAELEKEEELELSKVQEEEDADGASKVKKAKGKSKKSKANKATMDAEDKPGKPVKRKLDFDEEVQEPEWAEDEAEEGAKLWDHMDIGESMPEEKAAPEAKGKGKKKKKMATPEKEQPATKEQVLKDLRQLRLLDTSMQIPLDWAERSSFTLAADPKVFENDDGMGISTIGVLFNGAFYVSPVTEQRLEFVNEHARLERKLEANLKHGVHISWEKGNLGDVQEK